jgi:hypothetical protein
MNASADKVLNRLHTIFSVFDLARFTLRESRDSHAFIIIATARIPLPPQHWLLSVQWCVGMRY